MARNCPSCALEVDSRADTCPRCGTALSADDRAPGGPPGDVPGDTGSAPDAGPGTAGVPGRPSRPGTTDPVGATNGSGAGSGGWPGDATVRNWAMAAHLAAFSIFFVAIPVIGPVIVWAVKREEHPFIDHHGKEAVNFNISVLIYGIIAAISLLLLVGFLLLPLLFLFWFIVTIVAAVKAAGGEWYRYPLTIRFLS